jgi:hypothetical protein
MLRWRFYISLAVAFGLLQVGALAQKPGAKKEPPQRDNQKELSQKDLAAQKELLKAKQIAITPEREAAVTKFVEKNHSELAALLAHLKTSQPKEYERAVRDLFRVTEKFAMVKERGDEQYGLELKAWKAQSRAQLLVARLKMTDPESADSEELKTQLREILTEQLQARIEVMKLERERTTARLEKLNQDIGKFEQNREAVIDSHVNNLMNQVNANRPKNNKPTDKRPGDKKPAPKPTS